MDRFSYQIHHVPGKNLYTADTLSRAPLRSQSNDKNLEELAELLVVVDISHIPTGESRLEEYRQEQKTDPICIQLRELCQRGWPNKRTLAPQLKLY